MGSTTFFVSRLVRKTRPNFYPLFKDFDHFFADFQDLSLMCKIYANWILRFLALKKRPKFSQFSRFLPRRFFFFYCGDLHTQMTNTGSIRFETRYGASSSAFATQIGVVTKGPVPSLSSPPNSTTPRPTQHECIGAPSQFRCMWSYFSWSPSLLHNLCFF